MEKHFDNHVIFLSNINNCMNFKSLFVFRHALKFRKLLVSVISHSLKKQCKILNSDMSEENSKESVLISYIHYKIHSYGRDA
jgi:hypothetical protein